jgi:hypothetical protein
MSSPPQTAEIPYNAVPTNPVLPRTYSSTSSGRKSYGPFGGGAGSDRESGKFQAYDEDDDEVSRGHGEWDDKGETLHETVVKAWPD